MLNRNEAEEVATIEVWKGNNGKYYINCIAYDDFAKGLSIEDGCWEERGAIKKCLFDHWYNSLYAIIHPTSRLAKRKTFGDVFNTMTDEQKELVYYAIEKAKGNIK